MTPPTPYYQDEWATIYHGDCRDVLPHVEADVVVTDPPFGTKAMDEALSEVERDLPERRAICGYPEALIAWCVRHRVVPEEWLTWWPTNAGAKSPGWRTVLQREVECWALWGTGDGSDLRVPKARSGLALPWDRLADRKPSDVWRDASPGVAFNAHRRLHRNEKPLSLMQKVVKLMSGGVVLDPFMGSGTTLVAAKNLGRKSIGIEIEERYCEIAGERLSQGVLDFGGGAHD